MSHTQHPSTLSSQFAAKSKHVSYSEPHVSGVVRSRRLISRQSNVLSSSAVSEKEIVLNVLSCSQLRIDSELDMDKFL